MHAVSLHQNCMHHLLPIGNLLTASAFDKVMEPSIRSLIDGKEAITLKGLALSLSTLLISFLVFLTTARTLSMLAASKDASIG